MSYKINPEKWNKIFAVPTEVVDKHIKLAGSAQLKVLLWVLRVGSDEFDIDALSKATGIANADALDAMQYWIETGVIIKGREAVKAQPKISKEPKPEAKKNETPPDVPNVVDLANKSVCDKPTTVDVAKRGQESPELRFLWNQAQDKLGKTLSFNDQRTLLWMHDHLGLPIEVILMIIEYCVSMDKRGIGYIEKVGVSWAQEEIFSVDMAEKKLSDMKNRNSLWKKLSSEFGIPNPHPTAAQGRYIERWTSSLGFKIDTIERAFEECLDRTSKINFSYIDKVLENWHNEGVKTVKDIKINKPKATNGRDSTSYDLDQFERATLSKSIVYKKKED